MEAPDEGVGGASAPQHPDVLQNQNPETLMTSYQTALIFLQQYGWYLLFAVIAVIFVKHKLDPHIQAMRKRRQQQDLNSFDASVARSRQDAMDAARARMQEQHNAQAALHAEKVKEKEDQKRKEKLEDWERHQKGGGYRNKYKPAENADGASGSKKSSSNSEVKKKPLRPSDYNPLLGQSGGACYRPARRGGGGGGG